MGIFDWKHWAVILLIALVLFGGKRLRHLGGDLGESIKGFRRSMTDATDTNEIMPMVSSRGQDES
ncbi:twin-arginine translocase TatA/TatE family subunit [Pseudomonas sp. BN414]|uniref:twin-arginine translocase TatA/TatE family subunit n=1 Tax=Pseudomonas sp. BN414 TaxID=2567888 RepID=UPI002458264E|nr:twin-arginine translocase TatA/TatE family subunit [Pseudomonas sp. BN414]MDH4559936.1 twin-arginine translocase TatA/TatE family subunit [Pseudomonas sp. BN411]MDH4566639.1 twin-arginine translocase TatA/TatE family subunit [Pseudomonas sp. BN414]